jgi:hypothetical protein
LEKENYILEDCETACSLRGFIARLIVPPAFAADVRQWQAAAGDVNKTEAIRAEVLAASRCK